MANKKIWLGMPVMALVFGLAVVGCKSFYPVMYSDNSTKDYIRLGEVTYIGSGTNQGLLDFLAAARKKYPETDHIIDIMVDYKTSRFGDTYMYRGTAIKYK